MHNGTHAQQIQLRQTTASRVPRPSTVSGVPRLIGVDAERDEHTAGTDSTAEAEDTLRFERCERWRPPAALCAPPLILCAALGLLFPSPAILGVSRASR